MNAREQRVMRLIRDLSMLVARAEMCALPGSGSDAILALELSWIVTDLERLREDAWKVALLYEEAADRAREAGTFTVRAPDSASPSDPVGSGSEER